MTISTSGTTTFSWIANTAGTWINTFPWYPPSTGAAGVRVPRYPLPPTNGGAIALDLPRSQETTSPST